MKHLKRTMAQQRNWEISSVGMRDSGGRITSAAVGSSVHLKHVQPPICLAPPPTSFDAMQRYPLRRDEISPVARSDYERADGAVGIAAGICLLGAPHCESNPRSPQFDRVSVAIRYGAGGRWPRPFSAFGNNVDPIRRERVTLCLPLQNGLARKRLTGGLPALPTKNAVPVKMASGLARHETVPPRNSSATDHTCSLPQSW